jgi:hypothetical protein
MEMMVMGQNICQEKIWRKNLEKSGMQKISAGAFTVLSHRHAANPSSWSLVPQPSQNTQANTLACTHPYTHTRLLAHAPDKVLKRRAQQRLEASSVGARVRRARAFEKVPADAEGSGRIK